MRRKTHNSVSVASASQGVLLLLVLNASSCAEAGGVRITRTELSLDGDLLRSVLEEASTFLLVASIEETRDRRAVFCDNAGLAGRSRYTEDFSPIEESFTISVVGVSAGCWQDTNIVTELLRVSDGDTCPSPSGPDDVNDLLGLDLSDVLASKSFTVPASETHCQQTTIEAYGTPLLGPVSIPDPVRLDMGVDAISQSEQE